MIDFFRSFALKLSLPFIGILSNCSNLPSPINGHVPTRVLFSKSFIGGSEPDLGCSVTNYYKLRTLSFFITI